MTEKRESARSPFAVPGWMIDLITDGVKTYGKGYGGQSNEVRFATRKVMLSAHQLGIDWTYLRGLLTDTHERRLAVQISDYFGALGRSATKRNAFLREQWADTARVAAARPKWTQQEIDGFIAYVRANLHRANDLSARDRAIVEYAVERAEHHRMMRPIITSRELAERLGVPQRTADRALKAVASRKVWLSMAVRGRGGKDAAKRRGTSWHLAPSLVPEYRSVLMAHRSLPSTYEPPTYEPPTKGDDEMVTITTTTTAGSAEEAVRAHRMMLAALADGSEAEVDTATGEVRHLRSVDGSAA